MKPLKHLAAWKDLEQHFKVMRTFDTHIAFHEDTRPVLTMSVSISPSAAPSSVRVLDEHDASPQELIANIRRRYRRSN
ncbi:hypothetical protein [Thiobacillus sp.]